MTCHCPTLKKAPQIHNTDNTFVLDVASRRVVGLGRWTNDGSYASINLCYSTGMSKFTSGGGDAWVPENNCNYVVNLHTSSITGCGINVMAYCLLQRYYKYCGFPFGEHGRAKDQIGYSSMNWRETDNAKLYRSSLSIPRNTKINSQIEFVSSYVRTTLGS